MNSLPDLSIDDFRSFFLAVNGHEPFPWQERLARQVEDTGWPALLDLPTGAGKTAALDVAVFALALDAGRPQRRAPLRIVYVVDRRTIVDQAHARAEGALRHALRSASSPVVASVRDRLASFSAAKNPLATVLLRGGIARDDSWARTPDQPLIVVSTVDQVGSRLLFRGYGVADSMRPVHAGLLGHDVLFLLDEVHLSNPFRETLTAIADRYRGWAERSLPVPFRVVEMSATPGSRGIEVFHLAPSDHEHPTLARRLHVSKPAVLVETPRRGFANAVEAQVLPMLAGPGATVAVVVNRVRSARELHARLRGVVAPAVAVHLLTGRMRPIDRDALEASVVPRVKAGRQRRADDTPIVVVATQSIEAGADFDFDGLVTECASIDALKQRFGRLDRLGALVGGARGAIVASPDTFADDPVYGDAIGATWRWLQDAAVTGTVDVGSSALSIPDDAAHLLAPRPSAPILLPRHLDAWVQTSPTPEPDPDVALWLHGPQRGTADVQVVWRSDISEELLRQANEGGPLRAAAADLAIGMVDALPPVSAEAMSVPFVAARCWLAGEPEADASDVEGGADPDDTSDISAADRVGRPAIVWLGESSAVIGADALRPGQTIVVPSSYGGIAHGNWAPDSLIPVSDVAEVAAARQRRRIVVRLHPSVMPPALGRPPEPAPADSTDTDAPSDRELVLGWMSEIPASAECAEWRELLALLEADGRAIRVERMAAAIGEARSEYFIVTGAPRAAGGATDVLPDDDRSSDDEQSSMTGARIGLAAHLDGVAALAASMGQRVGLPADVVSDVQWAAKWHDAGKADPRFQRWLHGGSEFRALVQAEPLAKSPIRLGGRDAIRRARERAGYPAGTRHEFQSLALADAAGAAWAERAVDADLVRHLVASHHGHARPLAPWVPDATPVDVAFSSGDIACTASSAHTLARLDSGIVDRFWILVQRYGWWGLAYWRRSCALPITARASVNRATRRRVVPDVILSGLDGSNPLGFLAAAGVLAAVSQSPRARMTWRYDGVWHPVIDSEHADLDALMSYLDADRRECLTDQALQLTYDGKRDLKPPPGEFRGYLAVLRDAAGPTARRSIDWAAAFGTDVAVDNKGNTKPTALHFTAGQQQFLQMVAELSQQVGPDDLREALAGPWRYARPLPVMGWDATSSRDYALRGSDPSTDKKLGVPGADWLAVRGLTFLPCMPKGRRVATTACRGGWKDGVFTWPLWDGSLSARTVRSLLGFDVQGLSADERQSRGVVAVFSSAIKRSDQGGYGSFAPAATV